MTKNPGSAHDTTVKSTVLDAQAHLCLLASNALHVVKKKSEFPVRFFGFVTVYRGLLCTHWKFKKRSSGCRPPFDSLNCKVNFRDPKQFISHVCERVRDRNERK